MPDPITDEPGRLPSPYPTGALRELLINAMVHQELHSYSAAYAAPTIEIFDNRIEVSNAGAPLVNIATIANCQPMIRNQKLFDLFASLGLCDNKEHGWEAIIDGCEQTQIPSPQIGGLDLLRLRECVDTVDAMSGFADDEGLELGRSSEGPAMVAALSLVGSLSNDESIEETRMFEEPEESVEVFPGTKVLAIAPASQSSMIDDAEGGRFVVTIGHPALFRNMPDEEKLKAAYWHACTLFAKGKAMTNASLRKRFLLGKSQTAQVSRLIRACLDAGLIRAIDEDAPLKLMQYVPAWA